MATTHYLYVSFDDPGTADNARTWTDISSRLRSQDSNAGRDSELDAFDAMQAGLSLDNRDREFDPTNGSSSHAPNVVPNRMLWYRIDVDGTLYDVFKGYVNGWNPEWDTASVGDFRARPSLTDRTKLLNLSNFTAASPDVLDYPDVIVADEPSFYYRLGEPAGTKLIHHARRKRKRHEHEARKHYHRHGFKRWATRATRAEIEGESGPAGTYKATPTLGATGAIAGDSDTAVRFTKASSEYARVGPIDSSDAIDTNLLSLEAWIKVASFAVGGTMTAIAGPFKTGVGSVFQLWTDNTAKLARFSVFNSAGVGTSTGASGPVLSTNTWYHVVGTWDGTTASIYINGSLEDSTTSARTLSAGDANEYFIIGAANSGGGAATEHWDGWIDEVAIYEKALAADRVQAHYDAGLLGFDAATTGGRILQVLKLHAPNEFADGTFSGNEITDTTRTTGTQGDGRPYNPDTFEGDYTISSERKWTSKQEAVAGRLTFVTDPAGSSRIVGRFEVRNGDIVSSGERLEVVKTFEQATGGLRYYAGSFYIPSGWVDTITGSQFKIINQWKDSADLGPPNLGFRLSNGAWNLQVNSGASAGSGVGATVLEETVLSSFAKDVWNDWIMEVYWTTTAVTGQGVRIWHKRGTDSAYTKVYEHLNIPTLLTGGGTSSSVYYKEGEYRNISPRTETDVLYHDKFREGRSYLDMVYGTQDPDGTSGIWPSAINLLLNGNATTNTTTHTALGVGTTVTRETTTDVAFGGTRIKIVTPGTVTGEGDSARTATSLQGTSGVAAGDTFIGSVFLKKKAAAPHGSIVLAIRVNYTDATNDELTQNYDLTEYWQRYYSPSITANGAKTINSVDIRPRTTTTAQALEFYAGGYQIEEGVVATPYIETDGAAASRSAARVRMPVTNLDETQCWAAFRVRVGSATLDRDFALFAWGDDATHALRAYWSKSIGPGSFNVGRGNGSITDVVKAAVFPRGDYMTFVAAWDATHVRASVDGSAFSQAAQSSIPTLAATTFDIGSGGTIFANQELGGDLVWAAWGKGALTDADAAAIYTYGPWSSALSDKKGLTIWDGWQTTVSDWHIDVGTRNMPPARYAGLPPKELIDDAVAAEGDPARFLISKSGFPTFLDSTHRSRAPYSATRYTFGDGVGEIPFQEVRLSDEDAFLYNDVRATREDGDATFQATDSTSITRFGRLVLPLDSIPLADDTTVQSYVDAMLARYKDPMTRISSFVVYGTTAAIRQAILSLEIGDQVRIRWQPPQGGSKIDQMSYIERRKISGDPQTVEVVGEFSVSPR